MVGFNEHQKVAAISKVFADSYKSPESVIVVDNVERLLGALLICTGLQCN
jgi:vesicle-fusing ATPase